MSELFIARSRYLDPYDAEGKLLPLLNAVRFEVHFRRDIDLK